MFTDAASELQNSINNLKLSLLLSTAINVVLIVLVSTLFDGTDGFCDDAAASARESFRFVFLFQILVNAPTFISYHLADKYMDGEAQDETVRNSFCAFLVAFLLKIYMTSKTFLNGPFEDNTFVCLVAIFVLLSFVSYVLIVRYARKTIITTF